jgi:DNA-binding IclR family transcriptional regulator
LARRTGVPRQTVLRKVDELVAAGIMEKQGRGYVPARSFIATAGGAGKYEKRRVQLLQAIGCSECLPQKNHQNVQRS